MPYSKNNTFRNLNKLKWHQNRNRTPRRKSKCKLILLSNFYKAKMRSLIRKCKRNNTDFSDKTGSKSLKKRKN